MIKDVPHLKSFPLYVVSVLSYQDNNCNKPSKYVRGLTMLEGTDQMLYPQLRLCLASGVQKRKEKSVTQ